MPKISLDEFDIKILDRLQSRGRLTNVELAEEIGLSPSPCLRRVRFLEAAGVIQGYSAKIDRAKVGLGLTIFAEVKLARHSTADAEAFVQQIQRMPEVVSCQLVSGEADYLLEIVVSDLDHYTRSVVRNFRNIEGLQSMQTRFVLEVVKRSTHLPLDLLDPSSA